MAGKSLQPNPGLIMGDNEIRPRTSAAVPETGSAMDGAEVRPDDSIPVKRLREEHLSQAAGEGGYTARPWLG